MSTMDKAQRVLVPNQIVEQESDLSSDAAGSVLVSDQCMNIQYSLPANSEKVVISQGPPRFAGSETEVQGRKSSMATDTHLQSELEKTKPKISVTQTYARRAKIPNEMRVVSMKGNCRIWEPVPGKVCKVPVTREIKPVIIDTVTAKTSTSTSISGSPSVGKHLLAQQAASPSTIKKPSVLSAGRDHNLASLRKSPLSKLSENTMSSKSLGKAIAEKKASILREISKAMKEAVSSKNTDHSTSKPSGNIESSVKAVTSKQYVCKGDKIQNLKLTQHDISSLPQGTKIIIPGDVHVSDEHDVVQTSPVASISVSGSLKEGSLTNKVQERNVLKPVVTETSSEQPWQTKQVSQMPPSTTVKSSPSQGILVTRLSVPASGTKSIVSPIAVPSMMTPVVAQTTSLVSPIMTVATSTGNSRVTSSSTSKINNTITGEKTGSNAMGTFIITQNLNPIMAPAASGKSTATVAPKKSQNIAPPSGKGTPPKVGASASTLKHGNNQLQAVKTVPSTAGVQYITQVPAVSGARSSQALFVQTIQPTTLGGGQATILRSTPGSNILQSPVISTPAVNLQPNIVHTMQALPIMSTGGQGNHASLVQSMQPTFVVMPSANLQTGQASTVQGVLGIVPTLQPVAPLKTGAQTLTAVQPAARNSKHKGSNLIRAAPAAVARPPVSAVSGMPIMSAMPTVIQPGSVQGAFNSAPMFLAIMNNPQSTPNVPTPQSPQKSPSTQNVTSSLNAQTSNNIKISQDSNIASNVNHKKTSHILSKPRKQLFPIQLTPETNINISPKVSSQQEIDTSLSDIIIDSFSAEYSQSIPDEKASKIKTVQKDKAKVSVSSNNHMKESISQKKKEKTREEKQRKTSAGSSESKLSLDDSAHDKSALARLKKIEKLCEELPPQEAYIYFTGEDCYKLEESISDTTRGIQKMTKEVTRFLDKRKGPKYISSETQTDETIKDVVQESVQKITQHSTQATQTYIKPVQEGIKKMEDAPTPGHVMCRLCAGCYGRNSVVALFGKAASNKELVPMINSVLPQYLRVAEMDKMPQQMCIPCVQKLTSCYDTIAQFKHANEKLHGMFGSPERTLQDLLEAPESPADTTVVSPQISEERKCEKRPRTSSLNERDDCGEEHEKKRMHLDSPARVPDSPRRDAVTPASPVKCIDLSRLDPEYDCGFEVEWCLDEETIRSSIVQYSPSNVSDVRGSAEADSTPSSAAAAAQQSSDAQAVADTAAVAAGAASSKPSCADGALRSVGDTDTAVADSYACPCCEMTFPFMSESFLHQVVRHLDATCNVSHPQKVPSSGARSAINDKQQAEVSLLKRCLDKRGQEVFKCDDCSSVLPNQYTLCSHKYIVHNITPDTETVSKLKHDINEIEISDSNKQNRVHRDELKSNLSMQKNHDKSLNRFQCITCAIFFNSRDSLEDHMKSHKVMSQTLDRTSDTATSFERDKSNECFSQQGLLVSHQQCHGKQANSFSCKHCMRTFSDKVLLMSHMQKHTSGQIYVCDVCDQSFTSSKSLNNHLSSHIAQEHVCESCGLIIQDLCRLKHHKKEHSKHLPCICQICGKRYPNIGALRSHKLLHGSTGGSYMCSVCKKHLFFKNSLVHHAFQHMKRTFRCQICFKLFSSFAQRSKHLAIHHLSKILECCICHTFFMTRSSFMKHRYQEHFLFQIAKARILKSNIQEPLPRYQCNVCDVMLRSKLQLRSHQALHSSVRPFYCNECGHSYISRAHLLQHKRQHGVPLRQCNVCGRTFQNKRTYMQHKYLHTSGQKFVVPFSGKIFQWCSSSTQSEDNMYSVAPSMPILDYLEKKEPQKV